MVSKKQKNFFSPLLFGLRVLTPSIFEHSFSHFSIVFITVLHWRSLTFFTSSFLSLCFCFFFHLLKVMFSFIWAGASRTAGRCPGSTPWSPSRSGGSSGTRAPCPGPAREKKIKKGIEQNRYCTIRKVRKRESRPEHTQRSALAPPPFLSILPLLYLVLCAII